MPRSRKASNPGGGRRKGAGEGKAGGSSAVQRQRYFLLTWLSVLGVVYGDIGTSPLYALRECFHGPQALAPTSANVLGVLSLIFWSLAIVISVKYLVLVMRADSDGEGGILVLTMLSLRGRMSGKGRWIVTILGLFGAGLLYGDGMITPAISVLSAVEGIQIATPAFQPYIVPITLAILFGLFLVQHKGTARVGGVFGPVMVVWFACLALLGIVAIVREPVVLSAISPHHAIAFFWHNRWAGFVILGLVFLVVTGGEALYADMGHFGPRPIRMVWFALVLPALLINYFGQGALLIGNRAVAESPFYHLAPEWARYPLVALATAATVIASQAVISGAFSLARQAIHFGYSPRLAIVHTSGEERGQIYVPAVNWALFAAVVGLVLAFGSSSNLAGAYGVAVNTAMVITAMLLYLVARDRWKWPRGIAGAVVGLFLAVDIAFFAANVVKIMAGGWVPLLVGASACLLMTTWKRGRQMVERSFRARTVKPEALVEKIRRNPPRRVPGAAVYLTAHSELVPPALLHNLEHNKVLHKTVGILTILTDEEPRVPPRRRIDISPLGAGLYKITAHYGFMERPYVPRALREVSKQHGVDFTRPDTSFFLGRETLEASGRRKMARWRKQLFVWMSRNSHDASAHFGIPAGQVVEIGVQLDI